MKSYLGNKYQITNNLQKADWVISETAWKRLPHQSLDSYRKHLLGELREKKLRLNDLIEQKDLICKEHLRPMVIGCSVYPTVSEADVLCSMLDSYEEVVTPVKWACIVDPKADSEFVHQHLNQCLPFVCRNTNHIQVLAHYPDSVSSPINTYCTEQGLKVKYYIAQTRYGSEAEEVRDYDIINDSTHITVIGSLGKYQKQLILNSGKPQVIYGM